LFTLTAETSGPEYRLAAPFNLALPTKESPAFRRDLPPQLVPKLAATLPLLIGVLATATLTVRILLLLSGLLATALLLTGLLARVLVLLAGVLVLLARILVLVRH
jgi:hypothetical protein